MPDTLTTREAHEQWSRLIAQVREAGASVVLTEDGEPVARLVPVAKKQPRMPGLDEGQVHLAEDFDAPLPADVLDVFESR